MVVPLNLGIHLLLRNITKLVKHVGHPQVDGRIHLYYGDCYKKCLLIPGQIQWINICRKFLEAIMLANIAIVDGKSIWGDAINLMEDVGRSTQNKWKK